MSSSALHLEPAAVVSAVAAGLIVMALLRFYCGFQWPTALGGMAALILAGLLLNGFGYLPPAAIFIGAIWCAILGVVFATGIPYYRRLQGETLHSSGPVAMLSGGAVTASLKRNQGVEYLLIKWVQGRSYNYYRLEKDEARRLLGAIGEAVEKMGREI